MLVRICDDYLELSVIRVSGCRYPGDKVYEVPDHILHSWERAKRAYQDSQAEIRKYIKEAGIPLEGS